MTDPDPGTVPDVRGPKRPLCGRCRSPLGWVRGHEDKPLCPDCQEENSEEE